MKARLLDFLCCPVCAGSLSIDVHAEDVGEHGSEIIEGFLNCVCGKIYPIVGGIPRMLPDPLLAQCLHVNHADFLQRHAARFTAPAFTALTGSGQRKARTMQAFGYQWTTFIDNFGYFRDLFLSFVRPFLRPEDFSGKLVLEVGCGSGRPASVVSSFGAELVAVDLSEAVETAYAQTARYPKLHVVQADGYSLPFRPCFDLVYSVGVLQHMPDPGLAVVSMARVVPVGRPLVLWVYGRREFWYKPVDWLRIMTTRMPFRLLRLLSVLMALVSELFLLCPYRILSRWSPTRAIAERIPGRIYAQFPFRENVLGWFDRLAAPVTHYFSRENVQTMLADAGFESIEVVARPGASASWVAHAVRGDGELP